jgi:lipoate-protein ligase A
MEARMTTVRLAPFAAADGPHNMAADETLLDAAGAGAASLRFYGWSAPTVSLGYFQPHSVRRSDARLAGLAWVRRPTGGAALVHHNELTYALALPSGPPWQACSEPWLTRMHAIIAEALAGLGAAPVNAAKEIRQGDVLCFQHHTPGDLCIGPAKIVGSAQRRQHGALLQHGAVLLAASPFAPALPGVAELTARVVSPQEVAAAVRDAFVRTKGWTLAPTEWTADECRRIDELASAKYSQPWWNEKR